MLPPLVSSCPAVAPRAAPRQLAIACAFRSWPRSSRAPPQCVSRTARAWPALSLSSAHSGREEILPRHRALDKTAPPDLPALASNPCFVTPVRNVSACPSVSQRCNAASLPSKTSSSLRSPCHDPAPRCDSPYRRAVRSAPQFLPAWPHRCDSRLTTGSPGASHRGSPPERCSPACSPDGDRENNHAAPVRFAWPLLRSTCW